jgi:hypothetical protein
VWLVRSSPLEPLRDATVYNGRLLARSEFARLAPSSAASTFSAVSENLSCVSCFEEQSQVLPPLPHCRHGGNGASAAGAEATPRHGGNGGASSGGGEGRGRGSGGLDGPRGSPLPPPFLGRAAPLMLAWLRSDDLVLCGTLLTIPRDMTEVRERQRHQDLVPS